MGGKTQRICTAMDLYTGIDINKISQASYQIKLKKANKRAYARSENLETRDNKINTTKEIVNYYLYSSNLSIIDQAKVYCLENLSSKEMALEKIYILKDLKRINPDRITQGENYYDYKINKIKESSDLSNGEIDKYIQTRHIKTLQEYTKNNKYFTYYQKGTKKIDQDMNKILQYLLADEKAKPEKQKQLEGVAKKLVKASRESIAKYNSVNTKVAEKYAEFIRLCEKYKDVSNIVQYVR